MNLLFRYICITKILYLRLAFVIFKLKNDVLYNILQKKKIVLNKKMISFTLTYIITNLLQQYMLRISHQLKQEFQLQLFILDF